jgi:putative ABC transport system substrate-binding protein
MASAMTINSRRREFMAALGGAAAWPFTARAQQAVLPLIGFICGGSAESALGTGFRRGLGEAGYREGQNVAVEYHWLNNEVDRLPALIADLVSRAAVIATPLALSATLAAKAASATIPIVFAIAQDPLKIGLVASYPRPGGKLTGFNLMTRDITAKRLELLHQLVPNAVNIAVLINPGDAPTNNQTTTQLLQEASYQLGLQIHVIHASSTDEIDSAFATIVRQRLDALFIPVSLFFFARRVQIATLAAQDRVPVSYPNIGMVQVGGLMSYGPDLVEIFYQVGQYCGKILNGANPAQMPVVQPTKFTFAINLKTARLLNITVPRRLLIFANELIE